MKYTIGELADIIDGDRGNNYPKHDDFFDNGYCLFLDTGNVTQTGFSFETTHFISKEKSESLRKGKISRGDIVYTTRGTVGNVAYYGSTIPYDHIRINSGMVILRPRENVVLAKFLFQILKHEKYRSYIKQYCTGSAQPQLPIRNLSQIKIDIPPLKTQEQVANVLSAYDALIENNQKQIKLLEEAAQRLYKEWFVDLRFPGHENTQIVNGVPEGWYKSTIEDIAEYLNGYAFKPSDWGTNGKPIIKIKEINEGVTPDTPRNTGEGIPSKYTIQAGDILFSWSATLAAKIWDDETGLLNQHLFKVTPKDGFSREFVLQTIMLSLDEFMNLTTGSTMKHIQRGKLAQVGVLIPNSALMSLYEADSEPMREQILTLSRKVNTLKEARDRLLPKLMNGEIEE